ncbi:MAG: hypothetical protein H7Z19_00720 [Chitinophagaceae bacterium]|nr:hypothetical protein [Rubrivivax sp.]
MDSLIWARQGALFVHAMAFAIALATVWREDLALLRTRRVSTARLAACATTLTWALAVLWASGLLLIGLQVGSDLQALVANPKLVAKLLVVSALTANGMALHALAFPKLHAGAGPGRMAPGEALLPVVLGAISSASWLAASFVGLSRLVAPTLQLSDYLALYAAMLVGAVLLAVAVFRPQRWQLAASVNP